MITRHAGAAVALLAALAAAAHAQTPQPAAPTPAPAPLPPRSRAIRRSRRAAPTRCRKPGVPKGEVIKGEFAASTIYPGTWREYWVYIPAGLDRTQPAPVMIFQDGLQYQAPVVFDNLIARKAIPKMVGVFVMHGRVKSGREDARDRMNRSYEYDSFNDTYARFLLEEMLPFVEKTHGIVLTKDPERARDRRQQQRRHRRLRRGVDAARRLPPRLQRHRHLRRPARRQQRRAARAPRRAEADPRLPAGRQATT